MRRAPGNKASAIRAGWRGYTLVFAAAVTLVTPAAAADDDGQALQTYWTSHALDLLADAFSVPVVAETDTAGRMLREIHISTGTVKEIRHDGKVVIEFEEAPLDLDYLARQPDAHIVRHTEQDGTETIKFDRGGATVIETIPPGGKPSVIFPFAGPEAKGTNYALCLWMLDARDLASLDACRPNENGDYRNELRYDLDQLTPFVARNFIYPLTLTQASKIEALMLRTWSLAGIPDRDRRLQASCQSGDAKRAIRDLLSQPPSVKRGDLEEALHTPPPVGALCPL